jgi:hypothetical protein
MGFEDSLNWLHPKYWLGREHIQEIFDTPHDIRPSWHYGRIKQFYHYATAKGWQLPRFIATEGLMDSMGDLKKFTDADGEEHDRLFEWNGHSATIYDHMMRHWGTPFSEFKGDISYLRMWSQILGVSEEDALFIVMSHVDRSFPEQCLGITLFTYSNAPDWNGYGHNYAPYQQYLKAMQELAQTRPNLWVGGRDYSYEGDFWADFEDVKIEEDEPMVDINVLQEKRYTITTNGNVNVRNAPGTIGTQVLTTINTDDVAFYAPEKYEQNKDGFVWEPILLDDNRRDLGIVWVAIQFVEFELIPHEDEPDTPPALEALIRQTFLDAADQYKILDNNLGAIDTQLEGIAEAVANARAASNNLWKIFSEAGDSLTPKS